LNALGITGTAASTQIDEFAGDAGKINVTGIFIFQFMKTTFAAVIT
jgi:hypothetical protein